MLSVCGHRIINSVFVRPTRTDAVTALNSKQATYRVSQKFVPLLYKSVTQYDWTWSAHNLNQSCDFQSNLLFHTSCVIFWLEIRLCNFPPKVRCASNFPAIYFCHFVTRNARATNLFCVNILEDKPSQRKKKHSWRYVRAEACISIYWLNYQLKKFLKNGKNSNDGW